MERQRRNDLKRHFLLDEGSLLFCDRTKRLFALNATATCLWILSKDGAQTDGLRRYLVDACGFSPAEARAYVCATLADWRDLGLFDGAEAPTTIEHLTEPDVTVRDGGATLTAPGEPLSLFVRCYKVLDQHWCVDFTSAETLSLVHPVLAHFESRREPSSRHVTIAALKSTNEYVIRYAGADWARCATRYELAPLLHALILNRSVEATRYDVAVHGAAVRAETGALLMPGAKGSGKTTLTAMLISDGLEYLSDDCVLLRSGKKLKAIGVPGSLCVKESGVAALAQRYPELKSLTAHRRGDGKAVRYLVPASSQFSQNTGEGEDIKWVIFLKYSTRKPTSMTSLSQFKGLSLLIRSCTIPRWLDVPAVESLVAWSSVTSYFAMNVSSSLQATRIIKDIVSWRAK